MNYIKTSVFITLLFLAAVESYGQNKFKKIDKLSQKQVMAQMDSLLNTKSAKDTASVKTLLSSLKEHKEERYVKIARMYYIKIGDKQTADLIYNNLVLKFPKGSTARQVAADNIFKLETGLEKENAYRRWIKDFPLDRFPDERLTNDYVASSTAGTYAKEGNYQKAFEFCGKLQETFWKSSGLSGVISTLYAKEHYSEALVLMEESVRCSKIYIDNPDDKSNEAGFARLGYYSLLPMYADLLLKNNKKNQAMLVLDEYDKNAKKKSDSGTFTYAKILVSLQNEDKAFEVLQTAITSGKASKDIEALFHTLYLKNKGDETAYSNYMKDVSSAQSKFLKEKLASEIIKEKAPAFTLRDVDGNTVSLSDYSGKVVILDFWATWCGPCKKSFPAMQMAINKYASDKTVEFLFIHTWEKTKNDPAVEAKDYITANKYSFKVLMDLKNPKTGDNKVVSAYGAQGIPAKFIVDGNGFIRFKLTGFTGSNEAAVEELSTIVDLVKKNQ
ncbi:TlpA disulfide reductase family protein [Flavobacterium panacagri]|uniref:TlpA disulfide reductase family protein n=1 Tax=Flavobacterium panacagri TaxID=3034146 RepID=UPI0025A581C4|nr:TlpA disulfide reductase family protein [Flavobacterium panacagri]